jgi:hypothetical protein
MRIHKTIKTLLVAAILGGVAAAEARAEVLHRYSFNDTGTTVTDTGTSATKQNGILVNNTGNAMFTGGKLVLGNDGSQNSSGGTDRMGNLDFVDFDNRIFADVAAEKTVMALEIWFTTTDEQGTWQRIWSFGNSVAGEGRSQGSNDNNTFGRLNHVVRTNGAVPSAAWGTEAALSPGGTTIGAGVNGTEAITANVQHQSIVVYDEVKGLFSMYIDGRLVARGDIPEEVSFQTMTEPSIVNPWLARSQWDDEGFVGSFDEFRIWNEEIGVLDAAGLNLAGPNSTTPADLGALQAVTIDRTAIAKMQVGETYQIGSVTADYANFPGLDVATLASFSTANAAVADISSDGLITATGAGDTKITVSYESFSLEIDVNVVDGYLKTATLAHRYSFDSDATDSIGGANGTLMGATVTGGSAVFDGAMQQYIDLPNNMISTIGEDVTVEGWVTTAAANNWSRIFDFGTGTKGEDPTWLPVPEGGYTPEQDYAGTDFFMYAPNRGNGNNAGRITVNGPQGQFDLDTNGAVPPNDEEYHFAAVVNYGERSVEFWVDGVQLNSGTLDYDDDLSLVADVNNWLGRSQYIGDAWFTGEINELRIYEGVRSSLQIAIGAAAGNDTLVDDVGTVSNVQFAETSVTTDEYLGAAGFTLTGEFSSAPGVPVALNSQPETSFTIDDESVATLLTNPYRINPVSVGTTTLRGSYLGQEASVTVTVEEVPLVLDHRWTFDGNANDSGTATTKYNGTLVGGATIANGALNTGGVGYLNLPNFMYSDYYYDAFNGNGNGPILTIEGWVVWQGGDDNQSIWDFGSVNVDPNNAQAGEDPPYPVAEGDPAYADRFTRGVFIRNSANQLYADLNGDGQPNLTGAGLPVGELSHVMMRMNPQQGNFQLFRNGVQVGSANLGNGSVNFINDYNVWFGRSNDNRAPLWNGTIEEIRIWNGWMPASVAALHYACGPDVLTCDPPQDLEFTGVAYDGMGTMTISWVGDGELQYSPVLPATTWTPVTPSGDHEHDVDASTGSGYFRVVGN